MQHSTMLDQVNRREPRHVRRSTIIAKGATCLICAGIVVLVIKCFVTDVVISGTQQTQIGQRVEVPVQLKSGELPMPNKE